MLLEPLVSVIETIKERIANHGSTLRENEIRTRLALIDPLLQALGWDISDPDMVTPEYSVGNGRADYALLGEAKSPIAFIEAKHLGEPLERPQHEDQLFTYALRQQVKFAALTDGNRWVLDDVSVFSGGERRLLQVSIDNIPAHEAALRLLLLWRPNLASGQPVAAEEPVLANHAETQFPAISSGQSVVDLPIVQPVPVQQSGSWTRLSEIGNVAGSPSPSAIRFSSGQPRPIGPWWQVFHEVAEWLVQRGTLTADKLPIVGIASINSSPFGPSGKPFEQPKQVSGSIYIRAKQSSEAIVKSSTLLLQHFRIDPSTVELQTD